MIPQYEVPFWLETPAGTLPINQQFGSTDTRRFQLAPSKCTSVLPVRSTDDDIPQGDGKIPHRRWRSGYTAHLSIEMFQSYDEDSGDGEPACDEVLVDMLAELGLHINEMIRTGLVQGEANARLRWRPSGAAGDGSEDWMMDRVQLVGASNGTIEGELGGMAVDMDLDSPYPYYIEAQETTTTIEPGDTEFITNNGNIDFFAVWKIYGSYTSFALTNHTVIDVDGNPATLVYDSALPPGVATFGVDSPDYIEFTFFRGSAYLNGNQASRIGGIDWTSSDFFPLVPGVNEIEFATVGEDTDTRAVCLSNGARG